jgi:anti-sigma B factor antagonist
MLNMNSKMENGVLNVAVEGELNTTTAPKFKEGLEPLLKEAMAVIIDFSKVDYISSAGLRVLLEVEQAMEDKGGEQVRILNVNEVLRHVFDITGFSNVLSLE